MNQNRSFVYLAGFLVLGIVGYFIWSTFLSARFSALGACDRGAGCLYTAVNGNRTVRVIGFSADNTRFLTDGTNDGIIHDASNGSKVATLDEGRDNHSYKLSHDRTEIIAHRDNSIKFFNWEGELQRTWTPNANDSVRDVAMVPLVNGFVVSGKTGVTLWESANGTLITYLTEETGIMEVAASVDGEVVAAYNFVDDEIIVWPLQDLDNAVVIGGIDALSIHLNRDGSLVAAGGPSGAYVWNTADGSLVTALEPNGMKSTAVGFSEDGTLLGVGAENGMVAVVDVMNDAIINTFEHEFPPDNITFMPDNSGMAVGLDYDVQISGGELIFDREVGEQFAPGDTLRTSDNRISVQPGYAIVWSLAK